jgi:hypothetical protein
MGGPLFAHGGQTLDGIGTPEAIKLVGQAGVKYTRLGPVPVIERLLRLADRRLSAGRQLHRDRQGPFLHLAVIHTQ